jgi:hypothetical protein
MTIEMDLKRHANRNAGWLDRAEREMRLTVRCSGHSRVPENQNLASIPRLTARHKAFVAAKPLDSIQNARNSACFMV